MATPDDQPANSSASTQTGLRGLRARHIGLFVFLIAILSSTLTNMDQSLFSYVLPQIMGSFDFSLNDTGTIISVSFLAAMIIAPIAGILADQWSRRWMLGICVGVSALLVGLQGMAQTQWQFLVLRALSFGFSAGLVPIMASMVANYASDKNRTWYLSLLQCGYPLGWFFASVVIALFLDLGWRTIFMVGFLVTPVAIIFAFSLPKNEMQPVEPGLMDRADPKMRGSIMGLCGSACVNAGFLVSPLVTTRLVEAIGWQWMYTMFVGSGLVLSGLFFFLAGLGKSGPSSGAEIEPEI